MTHPEFESVWSGRSALTDSLERDYAACCGEGWDLIYEPTSPLTTPWEYLLGVGLGRDALDNAQTHIDRIIESRRLRREAPQVQGMRNAIAVDEFLRREAWQNLQSKRRHKNKWPRTQRNGSRLKRTCRGETGRISASLSRAAASEESGAARSLAALQQK